MSDPVETQTIASAFSDVYAGLFPEVMEARIPVEVHATCHDCAMCNKTDSIDPGQAFFSARTKCCTYFPSLPNYLVGGLLGDDDPALDEGRRRIRARIDERHGISPHGVLAPRKYDLLYQSSDSSFFGKSTSMLCPYYESESGRCTVWRFRESTCSTYFCKFVKGADGVNLWQAAKDYVSAMEQSLVIHALLQLGFDPDVVLTTAPAKLSQAELDEVSDVTPRYRELWGAWLGREEELYRAAAEIVRALSPAELERIGGAAAAARLQRVQDRHRELTLPRLPPMLQRNPGLRVTRGPANDYLVVSFSSNQPFRMDRQLYECLDYFDGRHTVDEVAARLEEERRVTLTSDLVTKLYQFRILTAPVP